jgi:hypothetical protein
LEPTKAHISAAIQPIMVQPRKIFNIKIETTLLVFLRPATIEGKKYAAPRRIAILKGSTMGIY